MATSAPVSTTISSLVVGLSKPTTTQELVVGLRPSTLFKKKLWHRCFPVNFAKFSRTIFLLEHLWWLLLLSVVGQKIGDVDQKIHFKLSNNSFQIIAPVTLSILIGLTHLLLCCEHELSYFSKLSSFWKNTIIGCRAWILEFSFLYSTLICIKIFFNMQHADFL